MDILNVLAVVAVMSAWGALLYTIYRWGPGKGRRRVFCPSKGLRARIEVTQTEGEFCRLRVTDVTACSLLPGAPVTCSKDCLRQL